MNIMCSREKYWSEADDKEKIERCRRHIKYQADRIQTLEKQVSNLLSHQHVDGEIVIKMPSNSYGISERSRQSDENVVF